MTQRIALYPGSFDAATNGHLDLIQRAATHFDKVVVAVATNQEKNPLFSVEERLASLRLITKHLSNVEVTAFNSLTVDYARSIGAQFIIRGLRAVTDFEYELQLAMMNRQLDDTIESIFMVPSANFSFISSQLVKVIASLGGDVSEFVPPSVAEMLRKKFQ